MDADIGIRAKRRGLENSKENLEEVAKDLKRRDYHDSTRKESPLKRAENAILLDTSLLSIDEQVNIVISEIKKLNESYGPL